MAAHPAGGKLSSMDRPWTSIFRRPLLVAVAVAAAATVAAALAVVAVAGPVLIGRGEREAVPAVRYATAVVARTDSPDPQPGSFDFRDCPPLPAGTQPDRWRCEVLVATGRFQLGEVAV